MFESRFQYKILRAVAISLIVVFTIAAVADAAVCQKIDNADGNCLLPCICCHSPGVIFTTSIIYTENVTKFVQSPLRTAPIFLVSTLFHPPRD
jgi:hypothetical protein